MATLNLNFNGTSIYVKSMFVGEAKPWGDYVKQQHHCVVTCNGETVQFDYYCNDRQIGPKELINAMYCFASDGTSYANATDIDDFASEFGYEKVSKAIEVYNACKKSYDDFQKFGIDIFDFTNWLQEKYEL